MVWSAPRTWVHAEVPTAAIFNQHVRDNMLETGPAKITAPGQTLFTSGLNTIVGVPVGLRSSVLSSVLNSTVLVNATGLSFDIGANQIWHVQYILGVANAGGGVGLRFGWSYPAGLGGSVCDLTTSNAAGTGEAVSKNTVLAASGVFTTTVSGFANPDGVWLFLTVGNGATPGTVQLMFAQNVATALTTTINVGSIMRLVRMS